MAYLLDPGEGKYSLEDLALRYLSIELHLARPGRGHARPRRRRGRRPRPAAAPRSSSSSPTRSAKRCAARELVELYDVSSSRWCRCWRGWKTPACASTSRSSTSSARSSATSAGGRGRDPRAGGRAVQRQLDAAAAPDPLREAGPHAGQAHQDRPLDRRRLAAEDGGDAPDRRDAAAVPGSREAAQHLRRRAAAARARRRSHPRDLQPARDDHGPHLERVTEPPEHPGPHRPAVGSCAARSSPTRATRC